MKYTGILEDNRSQALKDKDFDSRELALGEVKFVTLKQAEKKAKAYIERTQFSKSSCVPSCVANAIWNTEQEILADEFLYSQRINKPQEGSYWHDVADKVLSQGICERSLLKEVKTESEANNVTLTAEQKENALLYRQQSYVWLKEKNFNDIASAINSGFAVPFSIWAMSKEWGKAKPEILYPDLTRDKANVLHAICAIPNTAYKDKDKYGFFITDSAHFGGYAKREITEDFYTTRFHAGLYFIDLEFKEPTKWITPAKYKGYKFTKDLTINSTGEDVNALQEILKANGYFPNMKTTSFFGGITRQAVKDFQKKYEKSILWVIGLKTPTGYFGAKTREVINQMLS